MFEATTSPWYLPTWVSSRTPVTSPMAHSRSADAQVRVDRDAVRAGGHAHRVQAGGHPRAPPGGDEQPVAAQLAAVVEDQHVVVAVAPGRDRLHAEDQLDAVPSQLLAEGVAERRGLAGQHVLGPLDQGHVAAEPAHDLGHLGADRAAAEDQQVTRHGLHAGHLAVGPHAVELAQPGDGRDDRIRAGRHHHVRARCSACRPPRPRRARPARRCRGSGRCPCPPASAAARRRSSWRP